MEELHERLNELPTDLEEYFQHMLDSTEEIYQKQAARIYQMFLTSSGNVSPHSGLVGFLHRTVHDFLTTRQVRELLEDRAGTDFNADLHLSNAVICELKHLSPGRLRSPYDDLNHCNWLVTRFMNTIHNLASQDNQEYLPLVDELERIIAELQTETMPTYASNSPTNMAAQYPEGWVMVMAIREGLFLYLSRAKRLGMLDGSKKFLGQPALDIALRPYRSTFRDSSRLSLNAKLVAFLLGLGMDPNAPHQKTTIWHLFLEDLVLEHKGSVSSHELAGMLECLLKAGADPDLYH
ncbi:MAG: hypothetical protein Q9201_006544, partial [Fulgogasparrea decipioides]